MSPVLERRIVRAIHRVMIAVSEKTSGPALLGRVSRRAFSAGLAGALAVGASPSSAAARIAREVLQEEGPCTFPWGGGACPNCTPDSCGSCTYSSGWCPGGDICWTTSGGSCCDCICYYSELNLFWPCGCFVPY